MEDTARTELNEVEQQNIENSINDIVESIEKNKGQPSVTFINNLNLLYRAPEKITIESLEKHLNDLNRKQAYFKVYQGIS